MLTAEDGSASGGHRERFGTWMSIIFKFHFIFGLSF